MKKVYAEKYLTYLFLFGIFLSTCVFFIGMFFTDTYSRLAWISLICGVSVGSWFGNLSMSYLILDNKSDEWGTLDNTPANKLGSFRLAPELAKSYFYNSMIPGNYLFSAWVFVTGLPVFLISLVFVTTAAVALLAYTLFNFNSEKYSTSTEIENMRRELQAVKSENSALQSNMQEMQKLA